MDKGEEIEIEDAEIVEEPEEDQVDDDEADEIESEDGEEDASEGDDDSEEGDEEESDAINVVIGEPEDEDETPVIRTLRKKMRDAERKAKELEKKLEGQASEKKAAELGPEPEIQDFDYDDKRFKDAILEWNDRKRAIEAEKEAQRKEAEAFEAEWQEKHAAYKARSKDIGIPDFEDTVEAQINDTLSGTQRSILIDVCRNPELVMLALSQNEALATKLAGEKNFVRFSAEVARLESKMKVTGMKPTTKPEKRPAGTRVAKSGNSQLEKLREAARKTGDFTEVNRYKQAQRNK
jgi:hypothetical protein